MDKRFVLLAVFGLFATSQAFAQDGSSCANAIPMQLNINYLADTTQATNWMTSFGPLVSPSNDLMYQYVLGGEEGTITESDPVTPISANYPFAMYLLSSCEESGTEPVPIAGTATVGTGLSLAGIGIEGMTYYVAVTGTAAGGPGANGTVRFEASFIAVTLQSFDID